MRAGVVGECPGQTGHLVGWVSARSCDRLETVGLWPGGSGRRTLAAVTWALNSEVWSGRELMPGFPAAPTRKTCHGNVASVRRAATVKSIFSLS